MRDVRSLTGHEGMSEEACSPFSFITGEYTLLCLSLLLSVSKESLVVFHISCQAQFHLCLGFIDSTLEQKDRIWASLSQSPHWICLSGILCTVRNLDKAIGYCGITFMLWFWRSKYDTFMTKIIFWPQLSASIVYWIGMDSTVVSIQEILVNFLYKLLIIDLLSLIIFNTEGGKTEQIKRTTKNRQTQGKTSIFLRLNFCSVPPFSLVISPSLVSSKVKCIPSQSLLLGIWKSRLLRLVLVYFWPSLLFTHFPLLLNVPHFFPLQQDGQQSFRTLLIPVWAPLWPTVLSRASLPWCGLHRPHVVVSPYWHRFLLDPQTL